MAKYTQGERVEHIQTGSQGTVVDPQADTSLVAWDPNEHGGYIDRHENDEIKPAR